jgi:hypothetical protein
MSRPLRLAVRWNYHGFNVAQLQEAAMSLYAGIDPYFGDWRDPRAERKRSGSRAGGYVTPIFPATGRRAFMVLLTGTAIWRPLFPIFNPRKGQNERPDPECPLECPLNVAESDTRSLGNSRFKT